MAVIDGSGHLSIFSVDEDGNLTRRGCAHHSPVPTALRWFGARTERGSQR